MLQKLLSISALVSFTTASMPVQVIAAPNPHFDAVNQHLEQRGLLYGFIDIDGDLARLSTAATGLLDSLRSFTPQLAQIPPLELEAIMSSLGLEDIKAIGISSSEQSSGYHNRTFILTEGSTKGILGIYDAENAPFEVLKIAPEGTDLAFEQTINITALIDSASQLMVTFFGEDSPALLEGYLTTPVPQTNLVVRDLIPLLDGRTSVIAEISETATISTQAFGEFPLVDFLVRIDSAAGMLEKIQAIPVLAQMAPEMTFERTEQSSRLANIWPAGGPYAPILVEDHISGALFIASSDAYYTKCLSLEAPKLSQSANFLSAMDKLSNEGLGLVYCSPEIKPLVEKYVELSVQQAGPQGEMMRPYMHWSFEGIMSDYPMATMSRHEPNGLLVASNWNLSHKRNLATLAYANPITIGLLAAMAIPAFQKVRTTSQEKTITNNLRQLASAADQYFLEYGATSVPTEALIGEQAYIRTLNSIVGETYPETIQMGEDIIATLPNGEVIKIEF